MKVAIAGAGSVGTAIAKDLHASGHDVLVLELDPDLRSLIADESDFSQLRGNPDFERLVSGRAPQP